MLDIRSLRTKRGLSLRLLAGMAQVSPAYLSKLENRRAANPTASVTARLAEALGVAPNALFASPRGEPVERDEWDDLIDAAWEEVRICAQDLWAFRQRFTHMPVEWFELTQAVFFGEVSGKHVTVGDVRRWRRPVYDQLGELERNLIVRVDTDVADGRRKPILIGAIGHLWRTQELGSLDHPFDQVAEFDDLDAAVVEHAARFWSKANHWLGSPLVARSLAEPPTATVSEHRSTWEARMQHRFEREFVARSIIVEHRARRKPISRTAARAIARLPPPIAYRVVDRNHRHANAKLAELDNLADSEFEFPPPGIVTEILERLSMNWAEVGPEALRAKLRAVARSTVLTTGAVLEELSAIYMRLSEQERGAARTTGRRSSP